MQKDSLSDKYLYDPLYGKFTPDSTFWKQANRDFWDFFTCPELQRLREVRLCNINSLYLPGGANVNRFEHALGTYYLAERCIKEWPELSPLATKVPHPKMREKRNFLIAALFHDFKTPPFGHSVEYIEKKKGFEHEDGGYESIDKVDPRLELDLVEERESGKEYTYWLSSHESLFFHDYPKLPELLNEKDLREIGKYINGKGRFGPLLNSDMDLDNIDNVFRLSYHMGLIDRDDTPLKLAQQLIVRNEKKVIKEQYLPLVKKWKNVRKKLYTFLLQNPGEFAAKGMLDQAIWLFQKHNSLNWNDVDFQLLEKLSNTTQLYRKNDLLSFRSKLPCSLKEGFERQKEKLDKGFVEKLRKQGLRVDPSFEVQATDDQYILKNKQVKFVVRPERGKLIAYKERSKPYDISDIVRRLMIGKLYGCLSIIALSAKDCGLLKRVFNYLNDNERQLELGEELSVRTRRKLPKKYNNINFAIHSIKDINKTDREISIETYSGKSIELSKKHDRVLIGILLENSTFDIYKIHNLPPQRRKTMYKISKKVIKEHLRDFENDLDFEQLNLYEENI